MLETSKDLVKLAKQQLELHQRLADSPFALQHLQLHYYYDQSIFRVW